MRGYYLKLSAISVFVIVHFIQITHSQSINSTETPVSDKFNETNIEPSTTPDLSAKKSTFQLKPILFDGEEMSYQEFLSRNPQRKELRSDLYPDEPYPGNTFTRVIETVNGTGVDIIIHDLDLNPTTDYIYIRGGTEANTNEKVIMYSGEPADLPIHLRILSSNSFVLQFESTKENTENYRGYLITYAAYGEIPDSTEPTTTPRPIEKHLYEFMMVHLEVPPEKQNNDTWSELRYSFSEMADRYIESQNISASKSDPDSVVMSIKSCPSTWKESEKCISVEFAIPVAIIMIDEDDKENQYKVNTTNFIYELTSDKLKHMWDMYGNEIMINMKLQIFKKQDSLILLMWVGISLAVIAAFLVVLYFIWRMDELNAYRRHRNNDSNSLVEEYPEKPSTMETPHRFQEIPRFMDNDINDINHDRMYLSENTIFKIDDDDPYQRRNPSIMGFSQTNSRAQKSNGMPKSALKIKTQFEPVNPPIPPSQYTDNDPNDNNDDDGRIKINTHLSNVDRPHHLYLPQDLTEEESNS